MNRKLNDLWTCLLRSPKTTSLFFGALTFLLRFPFVFRYDNHFGGDSAVNYVMALDLLNGQNYLFFNGADYVSTFEPFLASLVFRVFGPSIPLHGALMLLEWSAAVGIGVYLVIQAASVRAGICAGLVAAVGVPYTMTYTTVPSDSAFILFSMILLLEAYLIVEKGDSVLRMLVFGLTVGFAFFISKKCLPAIAVSLLVMAFVRNPVWQLKYWLKPLVFIPFIAAAVAGGSPEIWYKLHHPPSQQNIFGIVSRHHVIDNLRIVAKSTLAYFDAQPSSRMQDAFYYWIHPGDLQINAQSLGDRFCFWIAFLVFVFIFFYSLAALFKKNTGILLLGGLVIVTFLMMSASSRVFPSDNNLPRRYLLTAAIPLSLWTGLFFSKCFDAAMKHGRYLVLFLLFLFLGRCLLHNYVLWKSPDDLREVRWLVKDMDNHQMDRGLADFGLDYMIMGLTNKKTIIAEPEWHKLGSPIDREIVAKTDKIAVIGGGDKPVKKQIQIEFGGSYRFVERQIDVHYRVYQIAGEVRKSENLWWAPYQAQGGVKTLIVNP